MCLCNDFGPVKTFQVFPAMLPGSQKASQMERFFLRLEDYLAIPLQME